MLDRIGGGQSQTNYLQQQYISFVECGVVNVGVGVVYVVFGVVYVDIYDVDLLS